MFSLDITFCANKKCDRRAECGRSTELLLTYPQNDPRLKWTSMSSFKQDEKGYCKYFFPRSKEKGTPNENESENDR